MNEKLNKAIEVTTTTSFIDAKSHALCITTERLHVDIYTWGYREMPGNHTDIVFHDLTISELLQLGQSIMAEAGRLIVEREEK